MPPLAGPYAPNTVERADNWRTEAACSLWDSHLFHPDHEGTGPAFAVEAKQICGRCRVRPQCLEWALRIGDRFGVWGGLDAGERARLFVPAAPPPVVDDAAPQEPDPAPVQ
ncbi:WhiB family transcriptional regulator [Streptomyces sp. NBC_01207]|uniref:WhiB family transcriptional regulator n=1 Tax=Streptomyces sp. NBC_01207 TaxID=2903772 RepID=UPI002E0D8E0B|nr:WhiB family transcriptional regulator [Streptomyces sp. NBC_01207]